MVFRFADNSVPDSLASRLRRRRVELCFRLAEEFPAPVRVLDVGGHVNFWERHSDLVANRLHVTALNLHPAGDSEKPGYVQVQGDARSMPQYADHSFDLCFSNSVLEHVGTLYDQMAMAREVRRVSKAFVVQTPNRYFPLEPHFLFPLWQFYPKVMRRALVTRFSLGWMNREPDPLRALAEIEQIRLLNADEMRRLFPDAEILREKIGPLTKSFIAVRRWKAENGRPAVLSEECLPR